MSTLSVPLPANLIKAIDDLISRGIASSKAELVRRAIQKYVEDEAVEAVLKASKEPRLSGDLRTLMKQV